MVTLITETKIEKSLCRTELLNSPSYSIHSSKYILSITSSYIASKSALDILKYDNFDYHSVVYGQISTNELTEVL